MDDAQLKQYFLQQHDEEHFTAADANDWALFLAGFILMLMTR
ncbi:MAG: hypothetical protein ACD_43C00056G0001 [uncultured bacterium]|nr:MAG: hypothetical protein ACD_43C00056G0001 [uncultured bacterium]